MAEAIDYFVHDMFLTVAYTVNHKLQYTREICL